MRQCGGEGILGERFACCLGAVGDIWVRTREPWFFFYCLLPVACTSSHTACTEPNPTHSIPIPLKMFVFKECVSERDMPTRWLGTTVLGRLPNGAKCAFLFLRWVLYRSVVFTRVLLYLVCLIHMVEKHWIDR